MTTIEGFLTFDLVPAFLQRYRQAGDLPKFPSDVRFFWRESPYRAKKPNHSVFQLLYQMLVRGELTAAVLVKSSGALCWMPAALWQIDGAGAQVNRATTTGRVHIPRGDGGWPDFGVPLFAERALAEAFGAQNLPAAPKVEPGRLELPPLVSDEDVEIGLPAKPALASDHTGVPGRPTSSHLVRSEFLRRKAQGKVGRELGAECKVLANWLAATHPDLAPMTPKSIANSLRDAFRKHLT